MMASSPVRISGFHICSPDTPQFRAARATALLMRGAANRSRVRFHVGETAVDVGFLSNFSWRWLSLNSQHASLFHLGSPTECLYSLRAFGIPADCLPPIPEEGAKDALRKHHKWCLMRQTKEALMEKVGISHLSIVECPRPEDCLFGKG